MDNFWTSPARRNRSRGGLVQTLSKSTRPFIARLSAVQLPTATNSLDRSVLERGGRGGGCDRRTPSDGKTDGRRRIMAAVPDVPSDPLLQSRKRNPQRPLGGPHTMNQPKTAPNPDPAPQTDVYADERKLYETAREFFRAELDFALHSTDQLTNAHYVAARAVKALAGLAEIMPPPVADTDERFLAIASDNYGYLTDVVACARDLIKTARETLPDPEFLTGRYEPLGSALDALADLLDLEGVRA